MMISNVENRMESLNAYSILKVLVLFNISELLMETMYCELNDM